MPFSRMRASKIAEGRSSSRLVGVGFASEDLCLPKTPSAGKNLVSMERPAPIRRPPQTVIIYGRYSLKEVPEPLDSLGCFFDDQGSGNAPFRSSRSARNTQEPENARVRARSTYPLSDFLDFGSLTAGRGRQVCRRHSPSTRGLPYRHPPNRPRATGFAVLPSTRPSTDDPGIG